MNLLRCRLAAIRSASSADRSAWRSRTGRDAPATRAQARYLLASALVDMAETNLTKGEPLPKPNPAGTDTESDLEEPIYLLLQAASRVDLVPQNAVP